MLISFSCRKIYSYTPH